MRHRLSIRIWVMPLLLAALVAAHAIVLHHLTSHQAWTFGLGLILLMLLTHVGILGSISVIFGSRSKNKP